MAKLNSGTRIYGNVTIDTFATATGNAQGAEGMANFADSQLDGVIESAEECPGECIFIEP
jgi:hypothetical protein